LNKNRYKDLWKQRIVIKRALTLLLCFLAVFSVLPAFTGLISAQVGYVDVFLSVDPLLDKYGRVSMNDDGTFYPCDCFEVSYWVDLSSEYVFESADLSYDSAVFNMFTSSGLGSTVGVGAFEVLPSASAGTYQFYITVWGHIYATEIESDPDLNIDPDLEPVEKKEPESFVIADAGVSVQIVKYDPYFTVALVYTVPNGTGSSYDKPFALVIRYNGNGPNFNLNQRAIIDNYTWVGYAQKTPNTDTLQQALTPNLTVATFLNQTSNTQFSAQGIDAKTSQIILDVDGKSFLSSELPAEFFWEANTNHTYNWTQNLPIAGSIGSDEWFEWQSCLVFPPPINQNQVNQAANQEDLQNQLNEQINSKNGTLTTTTFGNTVTALYVHNKLADKFAKETGVSKDKTLKCLTPTPIYFTAQTRYAKIQYALDQAVVKEITKQGFTNALYFNLTVGCDMFGGPRYFEANFTTQYEFFDKPINTTAYKWNPTLQKWDIDTSVSISATFESALNFATTDILRSELEEQTSDPIALKMAMEDLYDSGAQTFTGMGSIKASLKRISPLYFNLAVEAGRAQKTLFCQTVALNFRDDKPYNIPLNFDSNSPLQVSVVSDGPQNALLLLDAPIELGGLSNVSVYLITNGAAGKDPSKDQLDLKLLKALNLTLTQEPSKPLGYEQNYQQFYQYYEGYSSISDGFLGFCGQTQIAVPKDKSTTAPTDQDTIWLYIEATNIWGTTFHQIITVQPYTTPNWNIPLNQVTMYLIVLVAIAVLVSLITYYIKTIQK
jgi:hypothetical protein